MKHFIICILFALCSLGMANAQEKPGRMAGTTNRSPEELAKMQVQQLHKELNLTQVQQDSVYKYTLINNQKTQELFKNAGNNREGMREQMMDARKKYNDRVKSFLTKEQVEAFDKWLQNMQQRGPNRYRTN